MMTLKSRLLERISRSSRPVAGGTLEVYAYDIGYKPSNAARRLRELAKEGKIIKTFRSRCVYYEANPEATRIFTLSRPAVRNEVLLQTVERKKVDNRTIQLCFELVARESPGL